MPDQQQQLDRQAHRHFEVGMSWLHRYLLRRRDWLVWLLRKDASLPRRWWSL